MNGIRQTNQKRRVLRLLKVLVSLVSVAQMDTELDLVGHKRDQMLQALANTGKDVFEMGRHNLFKQRDLDRHVPLQGQIARRNRS